jgi:hypothetical protein
VHCPCILIVVSTTTNISVVYDELTLQCVSVKLYQGLIKTETIIEKVNVCVDPKYHLCPSEQGLFRP